jgi:hypothetical protein
VAATEDVLAVYTRPRDLAIPLVCSDEIFPANHNWAISMRDRAEPRSKSAPRY